MFSYDRSRRHGTDLSFEAGFYGLSLTLPGNHGENLFRLKNLFRRHRKGLLRNLGDICEPGFADLLLAARLVEIDDDVRFFGLEICRRIVERNMPILPDAEERDVNWRRSYVLAGLARHGGRVGSISREQV